MPLKSIRKRPRKAIQMFYVYRARFTAVLHWGKYFALWLHVLKSLSSAKKVAHFFLRGKSSLYTSSVLPNRTRILQFRSEEHALHCAWALLCSNLPSTSNPQTGFSIADKFLTLHLKKTFNIQNASCSLRQT